MINHETSRADKGGCGSCTTKAFYNYTYRLALTRVDVEWANVTCNIVICNILHNNKAHKKDFSSFVDFIISGNITPHQLLWQHSLSLVCALSSLATPFVQAAADSGACSREAYIH